MGLMKKIWENAPIVSIDRCLTKWSIDDKEIKKSVPIQSLKLLGHFVYGLAVVGALAFYTIKGSLSNEWNPLQQTDAFDKLVQQKNEEHEQYDGAWKRLFSVNGLADKDKNGYISFNEQFDAWNKMGLIDVNNIYMESDGSKNFPEPTRDDLESGIQKYQAERSQ